MQNKKEIPANIFTVAPGVWGRRDVFVNFYMIQDLVTDDWIVVDTGVTWSTTKLKEMATYLFGEGSLPKAIILTHGHFDHVGALKKLADEWDVPVYAHHLEIPYLTGQSDYPPPDSTVGGGLLATMSFLYPKTSINIWRHLKVLPADGKIPMLQEWTYLHTPGHSPGHISLYRESDKVLIAGDAFVTTNQESVTSVLLQSKKVSGPPKYFTCDWQAAKTSVEKLADLDPKTAATGHGQPIRGTVLKQALAELSTNFNEKAVPTHGRYVPDPAVTNANGVLYVPPKKPNKGEIVIKAFTVSALVALGLVWKSYQTKKKIAYENFIDLEYNY